MRQETWRVIAFEGTSEERIWTRMFHTPGLLANVRKKIDPNAKEQCLCADDQWRDIT